LAIKSSSRDRIKYDPDIKHQTKIVKTPSIDEELNREEEIKASQEEEDLIQDYAEGLLLLDDAYNDLFNTLETQQIGLNLTIDPEEFPTLADAIAFCSDGKQNKLIDYTIYRKACKIVNDDVVRHIYTDHPIRGDVINAGDVINRDKIRRLKSRKDRLQKQIKTRLFNIAVRRLGAEIVRAIGKSVKGKIGVAGVGVGNAITKLMNKLADRLAGQPFGLAEFEAGVDFKSSDFNFTEGSQGS
jgi:hypothetical protein